MRTSIIPVVVGSQGLIGNASDRLIERTPSRPRLKEIKTVLTGTAHILRSALCSLYVFRFI